MKENIQEGRIQLREFIYRRVGFSLKEIIQEGRVQLIKVLMKDRVKK